MKRMYSLINSHRNIPASVNYFFCWKNCIFVTPLYSSFINSKKTVSAFPMPVFYLFEHIPGSLIAGSYGKSTFNFIRNPQIGFHSGYTNLRFTQQCLKVPIFVHPCQHLLFFLPFLKKILAYFVGVK